MSEVLNDNAYTSLLETHGAILRTYLVGWGSHRQTAPLEGTLMVPPTGSALRLTPGPETFEGGTGIVIAFTLPPTGH